MGKAIDDLRAADVRYHDWKEPDILLRAAILELARVAQLAHHHEFIEPGMAAVHVTGVDLISEAE